MYYREALIVIEGLASEVGIVARTKLDLERDKPLVGFLFQTICSAIAHADASIATTDQKIRAGFGILQLFLNFCRTTARMERVVQWAAVLVVPPWS